MPKSSRTMETPRLFSSLRMAMFSPLLRSRVAGEYSLSSRVEWLALRYEALLADRRAEAQRLPPKASEFLPPSEGLAYAEMISEVRSLRDQLATAQRELDAASRDDSDLKRDPLSRSAVEITKRAVRSVSERTTAVGRLIYRSTRSSPSE